MLMAGALTIAVGGCGDGSPPIHESRPHVATDSQDTAKPENTAVAVRVDVDARRPAMLLSEYHLFADLPNQVPNAGVIPYQLTTAQFLDHAQSRHYMYLPPGTKATYHDRDVFDFPVGSVLVQTIAFARDLNDASAGEQLVETRLMIHQTKGWVAVPYLWNEQGSDARRAVVGGKTDVAWRHYDGSERHLQFITPDMNQCKRCHKNEEIVAPIGTRACYLNREIDTGKGTMNQLAHWDQLGLLDGLPQDRSTIARVPDALRHRQWHGRRAGPHLAGRELRPLPQPTGPRERLGIGSVPGANRAHTAGCLQNARRRRTRFKRFSVWHRARFSRAFLPAH